MKASFVEQLRAGLSRTRDILNTPVEDLVRGRRLLDEQALESVEEALLAADMGVPAVSEAIEVLRARSGEIAGKGAEGMRAVLRDEIRRSLERPAGPVPFSVRPWVVFVVGVNGAGKTTTIGKLAASWKTEGRSVLVCAADTFRAAAAEQLEVWAERAGAQDAVLADTPGRLHTKTNLMTELGKMVRVAGREVEGAPHESLLVLDATVGANGLVQGREFAKAANVTGLVLTKLDGTAKGGVAVAVVRELGVPIRYVGVGESIDSLLPFEAGPFAESLVG
jgi:fused signal recognition particle receptor